MPQAGSRRGISGIGPFALRCVVLPYVVLPSMVLRCVLILISAKRHCVVWNATHVRQPRIEESRPLRLLVAGSNYMNVVGFFFMPVAVNRGLIMALNRFWITIQTRLLHWDLKLCKACVCRWGSIYCTVGSRL